MRVILKNVRLSFPDIWEPATFQGEGKAAFGASFLIPKDNKPLLKEINAAIDAVAKDKWAAKADAILKAMRAQDKSCLHDGDNKDYDGYQDSFYLSARNEARPTIIDRDKAPLTKTDGRPYSGCFVNAIIDLWAQDNQFGKRVNASLAGIQFYKDGDAFSGGRSASADDFDDLGSDEEDEAESDLV
jgi:hypothetical protein